MAIRHQPGANIPEGDSRNSDVNSSVPPGLEYLSHVNHIFVQQKKELFEILSGWEANNKYVITNGAGEQASELSTSAILIYYAFEENDCVSLQCCRNQRGFIIHIVDNFGQEVMRVVRDFRCCAGACEWCAVPESCCAHQLEVEAPPGNLIGRVTQRVSCCIPSYQINDHHGKAILNGPDCCSVFYGCGDRVFTLRSADDDSEVGCIRKQWSDILQELFTDADNFGVSFPSDLSVNMKATLIGATFLIDYVHFESHPNSTRRRRLLRV